MGNNEGGERVPPPPPACRQAPCPIFKQRGVLFWRVLVAMVGLSLSGIQGCRLRGAARCHLRCSRCLVGRAYPIAWAIVAARYNCRQYQTSKCSTNAEKNWRPTSVSHRVHSILRSTRRSGFGDAGGRSPAVDPAHRRVGAAVELEGAPRLLTARGEASRCSRVGGSKRTCARRSGGARAGRGEGSLLTASADWRTKATKVAIHSASSSGKSTYTHAPRLRRALRAAKSGHRAIPSRRGKRWPVAV